MVRHILVTTDGTSLSQPALEKAREMASDSRTVISVLHVVPDLSTVFPDAYDPPCLDRFHAERRRLRQNAQEALRAAISLLAGVQAQGLLRDAMGRTVAQVIANEANEQRVDLIVMSTRSHAGLSGFFSGNTAQGVLRLAHQPVLLVPSPPSSRFAWPADLTTTASRY